MIELLEQHKQDLLDIKGILEKVDTDAISLDNAINVSVALGLTIKYLKRLDKGIDEQDSLIEEQGAQMLNHDHAGHIEYDDFNFPYCSKCGDKLGVTV